MHRDITTASHGVNAVFTEMFRNYLITPVYYVYTYLTLFRYEV